ncbi:MAG: HlyD family efflux transporter periplasmic adaptor subunit [Clostridia bacterium]
MKKEFKFILLVLSIFLIFNLINFEKKAEKVLVETVSVQEMNIINQVIAKGYIEELSKSYVSINQNGIVQNAYFSVGDFVSKNDVIMTIQTTELQQNHSNNTVIELISNKNITILDTKGFGEIDIISNVDGVITTISNVASESILSGIPFLSVCDMDSLVAKISISEKNIKEIMLGQSVTISGDSFDDIIYGQIAQIMPYTTASFDLLNNSSSVQIEAIVEIENLSKNIIIGCSIEAKINVDEKKNALTIPFEAIYQENLQEYVYIVQNDEIEKREIVTGYEVSQNIEVLSGLDGTEKIVLTSGVFEGQEVFYEE